ncbi:mucosa-associated lymphoid tissue lymphoma translocation protein 1-like isoform X2 [Amphiura filiformis]|uniref:mucosa-associated lymphoid tissue lymphoma translocation protein 1-like isoform X2 n=1 Tax=Amphiura filiformis TaxID=82378 RepID=UPI003B21772C
MHNLNKMAQNLDPNTAIYELPYVILHELSRLLDGTSTQTNWRGLIAAIPEQIYDDITIEHFSLEIQRYGKSPSMALLRDLGNRGRTVKQLISYLDKMHHERALMKIKPHEKLRITQQPRSVAIKAGSETAMLVCNAKGFPYPRYQWFKAFATDEPERKEVSYEEVKNETDRIFKISPVTEESAGAYCCQIYHNFNREPEQVFTEWAYLQVLEVPEERSNNPLNDQPSEKPVIIKQPSSVSVQSGRSVKLECKATGCPAPKYQWHKMAKASGKLEPYPLKDQTSSEFYWAQVNPDDKGQYCCLVYNDVGREWSCTVEILIDSQVSAQGAKETIDIVRHPQSMVCSIGEAVTLACSGSASGQSALLYQWFKDQQEIPGSTSPELIFNAVKPEDRGKYQCRVSNTFITVWSNHATIDMQGVPRPGPAGRQFHATDKVALLIGNQDYRSAQQLNAPELDVGRLSNILFSQCGFKTVTLLNLTLEEMQFAMKAFCELLNNGVYGLFYFSGHGFESDGQSYLVPVDAGSGYSTDECVCAQQVLDLMQSRDTALNVLLLDICRKNNDYSPHASKKYTPQVKGNTVFGYAAQHNSQAYEVKGKPYGIFTEYLIKRITQHIKVSLVIEDVIEDVSQDEDAKDFQFPALSSDLRESRSIMDPIQFRGGHTMEYCHRTQLWTEAHELPESPIWKQFSYGVRVGIQLSARFSNIIDIDVFVADCGAMESCTAQLEEFSTRLDIRVDDTFLNLFNPDEQKSYKVPARKTNIRHLQRLQGDLTATLCVKCRTRDGKLLSMKQQLVIEKPLVAKLWQTKHYALPSEECFPDSTNGSYGDDFDSSMYKE